MFAACGRRAGSTFTTGPTMTKDQSGRAAAAGREQGEVDPLVDHSGIAEARARDSAPGPAGRRARSRARRKCAWSTLEGKGWILSWSARLASKIAWPPVKTRSAAWISAASFARRARAGRSRRPRARPCSRRRSRRRRPRDARPPATSSACRTRAPARAPRAAPPSGRAARRAARPASSGSTRSGTRGRTAVTGSAGEGVELEIGQVVRGRDHLLDEEHPAMAGEALHQVLGPLEDEVPAQVREADQVAVTQRGTCGGARDRRGAQIVQSSSPKPSVRGPRRAAPSRAPGRAA